MPSSIQATVISPADPVAAEFDLPVPLSPIADAIRRSRAMLDPRDDWDDEGSAGYAEATWRRAAELVTHASTAYWRHQRAVPPVPVITNGSDGSVDIIWERGPKRILINVPPELTSAAAYYGRDRQNPAREIQGGLLPADMNEWLLVWLME